MCIGWRLKGRLGMRPCCPGAGAVCMRPVWSASATRRNDHGGPTTGCSASEECIPVAGRHGTSTIRLVPVTGRQWYRNRDDRCEAQRLAKGLRTGEAQRGSHGQQAHRREQARRMRHELQGSRGDCCELYCRLEGCPGVADRDSEDLCSS